MSDEKMSAEFCDKYLAKQMEIAKTNLAAAQGLFVDYPRLDPYQQAECLMKIVNTVSVGLSAATNAANFRQRLIVERQEV